MSSQRSIDRKINNLLIYSLPMTVLDFSLWTIQKNKSMFIRKVIINKAGKRL